MHGHTPFYLIALPPAIRTYGIILAVAEPCNEIDTHNIITFLVVMKAPDRISLVIT